MLALALLPVSSASAQEKEVLPPRDEPGFVLSEVTPAHIAALTIGVAAQPGSGALQSLATLRLGEDRRLGVWTIEDPFLSSSFKIQFGVSRLFLSGTSISLGAPTLVPPMDVLLWYYLGDSRKLDFWTLIDTTVVRPIDSFLLQSINDDQPIPPPDSMSPEVRAWFTMMIYAGQTDVRAFEDASNPDLNYARLWQRPQLYRGKVVTMEGKLRQLDRIEAPTILRQAGFTHLYEGWLLLKNQVDPVCILFTQLPPEIKPGKELEYQVRFSGYFYKKYRYPDAAKKNRSAPLLIGRMPVLADLPKVADNDEPSWGSELLPVLLTLIFGTALAVLGMTFWFRHHDTHVRAKIATARTRNFVLPSPADDSPFFKDEVTKRLPDPSDRSEDFTGSSGPGS